ncbi:MAG: chromosome segregation protein SMC [Ancrocorticia sp.]
MLSGYFFAYCGFVHLKSLTLRGFKSFASSTTMRFEPGVNCVVGPNGSGKSNVVDALAWVMGEQGVKNLRGGLMADVIFAGTTKRPALGRAEVALTIDNSDGVLPIDYSEVTISRTLFRSGGSEYAINGTACRLLDIQELLSDTGMGREMHVIIGQGKLDAVLTASPEDRRGFIEEASGVLKHRKRKEKALRKLESMAGSLTRIEDLAAELRRQLGPLARQAEAARRADVIRADVRDARARLLADDLAQVEGLIQAQQVSEKEVARARERNSAEVNAAQSQVAELEASLATLRPQLAALTGQWERFVTLEERFRSLVQLAAERQRSLADHGSDSYRGERPEDIRERAKRSLTQEEALRGEVRACADRLDAAVGAREALEQSERSMERTIADLNRRVADQRETTARLAGQVNAARARIEGLSGEIGRVTAAGEAAAQRLEESRVQCEGLERELSQHKGDDGDLRAEYERLTHELEALRGDLAQQRKERQRLGESVASWRAKAETLALSLEPEDATAWILESGQPSLGQVRDGLQVVPGWESAAEAALSGAVAGIGADDVAQAVALLSSARAANAGRVEITIATNTHTDNAEDSLVPAILATMQVGAVWAPDVVSATGPLRATITALLRDTALATDLATAEKLLAAGVPRVATATGDVVTARRAFGGEVSASSSLERQRVHREAVAESEKAQQALDRCAANLARAEELHTHLQKQASAANAQLAAQNSQAAALTAQLQVVRRSEQSLEQEGTRTQERLARLTRELEQRREELAATEAKQRDHSDNPDELADELASFQQRYGAAHEATRKARQEETEARLRLRTSEERLRAVAGKAEALERNAQAVEERIERARRAAQRREASRTIAAGVEEDAQRALAAVTNLKAQTGEKRQRQEVQLASMDAALAQERQKLDALQQTARKLADSRHHHELQQAESRLRYEQLAKQSAEVLGVQADDLINEYGPHLPVLTAKGETPYVREEQERRLATAERALARLGKINPLALEEHAALEERQKYLSDQLADLKKSRDSLLSIVRDIDEHVEEVLDSALRDVAQYFEVVFERLFPGGHGRMVLTDPGSPLTTGVELEARPPGKRVKRLSLLSGGERSLTSIAFMVAIFMARPSPFYVMDEVEAALDDVNLSRLLDIFRELQKSSQLLVVTHQKRTMEIADTLYGVTMRDDGVSHVISQRMRDVAPI